MTHLPIFSVVFPGNTMIFYYVIAQTVNFDFIDTSEDIPVDRIFGLDLEE